MKHDIVMQTEHATFSFNLAYDQSMQADHMCTFKNELYSLFNKHQREQSLFKPPKIFTLPHCLHTSEYSSPASTVSSNDKTLEKRKFELLLPLTYCKFCRHIVPTIPCKLHMATNVMQSRNKIKMYLKNVMHFKKDE